jgi:hypothetical protein
VTLHFFPEILPAYAKQSSRFCPAAMALPQSGQQAVLLGHGQSGTEIEIGLEPARLACDLQWQVGCGDLRSRESTAALSIRLRSSRAFLENRIVGH